MSFMELQSDHEIQQRIIDNLVNDDELSQAIAEWTRTHHGLDADVDVSDSDQYWETYTFRLMTLAVRAIGSLVNHPTQQEYVALHKEEG